MNAIHRTGVNTGGVFGSDAGLGNYVGHKIFMLLGRTVGEPTNQFYQERSDRYRPLEDCDAKVEARIWLENSEPADGE
jgi:hypothetical protein